MQQGNVKKYKNLMKIVIIDEENLHIFRNIWKISMQLSGKICLMITLKVTEKQAFTLSLSRKYSFEKTTGWVKLIPQTF